MRNRIPATLPCWIMFCIVVLLPGTGAAIEAAPLRAVYIHTNDLIKSDATASEQAEHLRQTLDDIQSCHFTTIFPYANTSSGKSYFPSRQTGHAEGDILGALAEESRARSDLRFIPSVCVLVSGHDEPAGILLEHPEWALRDTEANPLGWISPAVPEARAWVAAYITEIARHTKADGILLDYMRFPNKEVRLDPASEALFEAAAPANESPKERKDRLQQFKETSITALMKLIHEQLEEIRPDFYTGIYSWGPHVAANHNVAQPWPAWTNAGYLQLLNISGYCYPENYRDQYMRVFSERLRGARELLNNQDVELSFALGVKTSHGALNAHWDIRQYTEAAEAAGVGGVAAFTWRTLAPWKEDVAKWGYFDPASRVTPPTPVEYHIEADLGPDTGQNFGTLFEVRDANGRSVAGAGFVGAYNTYHRAARLTLHAYVVPENDADQRTVTPITRPSESAHHYLYDADGQLFAEDRNAGTFKWNPLRDSWNPTTRRPGFTVADREFTTRANEITEGGRTVFSFDPQTGTAGTYYFAAGHLFFHLADANSPERKTHLHACAWDPATQPTVDTTNPVVLDLTAPGEFPYSYGQFNGDVIVGSNNGGVYRFRDKSWTTLRAANPKVSFQLYAMLNYRDRLLMGQYPTGELFEIVGEEIVRIEGWPPRMHGASPSAREAQSLAIYRGELFVGVWPWGEVWHHGGQPATWTLAARLFTQPEVRPETTAPYEDEMTALNEPVNNLWGQRITSLVPIGSDLIASTANKNGAHFDPRYTFLNNESPPEYGTAHRFHLPGHGSVPIQWQDGKLNLRIEIATTTLSIYRDNKLLATLATPHIDLDALRTLNPTLGTGVFGPYGGHLLQER